jgi:NAD(P)-dependent dehydrogenase (short-subunit alcohol dehydrogenase family)
MTVGEEFAGKVVIITGAAGGIGGATARRFVEEGAITVLVDRDAESLATIAAETGGDPEHVNLRDEAAIDTLVERVVKRHGRLDAVINIAGVFVGTEGRVAESSRTAWDLSLDVIFAQPPTSPLAHSRTSLQPPPVPWSTPPPPKQTLPTRHGLPTASPRQA